MAQVAEDTARKAIDVLVQGAASDQERAGQIPSASVFEDFARKIVAEQVAKNEEQPDFIERAPIATDEPKDRISRGEVGNDTVAIVRDAGTSDGELTRYADGKAVQPNFLLQARLFKLSRYPEWFERLHNATVEGETFARRMGVNDPNERNSIVADFVINVVDQSSATFGDWQVPELPKPRKIIVG